MPYELPPPLLTHWLGEKGLLLLGKCDTRMSQLIKFCNISFSVSNYVQLSIQRCEKRQNIWWVFHCIWSTMELIPSFFFRVGLSLLLSSFDRCVEEPFSDTEPFWRIQYCNTFISTTLVGTYSFMSIYLSTYLLLKNAVAWQVIGAFGVSMHLTSVPNKILVIITFNTNDRIFFLWSRYLSC